MECDLSSFSTPELRDTCEWKQLETLAVSQFDPWSFCSKFCELALRENISKFTLLLFEEFSFHIKWFKDSFSGFDGVKSKENQVGM